GKPGPVWIDIPLDVQASDIDPKELRTYDIDPQTFPVSAEDITETIRLLNKAHRPVLLLGNGIRQAKALNEMRQLIDLLNIPVLTTWNGVDLIEDSHPCFFGRPGASGQRHANLIQQNADFVLSIGSRLNLLTTGFDYDSFIADAVHVMVEIDPYEMKKKSVHPTLAIHADAASFLKELLAASDQIRLNDLNEWVAYCTRTKKRYPYLISEQIPEEDKINTYQLIDEISAQMTENDIYQFTSSGTGADIAMQAFRIKKGQRAFLTKGLASMGFDLPASIGSCLASGGRRTVCVTGDGGFLMNIQELATLYSLGLPVKIFLLDNNGYVMIYNYQAGNFHRLSGCTEESGLHIPDLIEISKAFGLRTRRITQASDLQRGIAETLSGSDPVICAVSVSIAQKILPRQTNYRLPDGRMASRPLEDMTPLLSREEMKQEMEISAKMIKGE
ncbi:MAG: thiamine pyrophosphate-binding protein, partial [Lachnospiraceae bacterium]|nr:thiamine pyrophosphate-binding protein [Lachnospiraceae bacterium]